MNNFADMMKQAQAMQQQLQDAQAKLAASEVEGAAGGGLVRLTLSGAGDLKGVVVDDSLMQPGDGEVLSDLLVAAHADAKRKLDAAQAKVMQDVAGPLAGALGGGGLPGFNL